MIFELKLPRTTRKWLFSNSECLLFITSIVEQWTDKTDIDKSNPISSDFNLLCYWTLLKKVWENKGS